MTQFSHSWLEMLFHHPTPPEKTTKPQTKPSNKKTWVASGHQDSLSICLCGIVFNHKLNKAFHKSIVIWQKQVWKKHFVLTFCIFLYASIVC